MTAQAVSLHQITKPSSIELACSTVQVAVTNICYTRNIFLNGAFEDVNVPGIDGQTKMLVTGNDAPDEANILNSWLTTGFRQALEDGYLTKMIFGFAADEECKNILEEYVFKIVKDDHGEIRLGFSETAHGRENRATSRPLPNVSSARKQVNMLFRNIVSISHTLEPVPDERYIFCKMEFSDDTPADYQPTGFIDAGDNAVGYFDMHPFHMPLGDVTTPYHNLSLRVRSVLDSVDVKPSNNGPIPDNGSNWEMITMMETGDDGRSKHGEEEMLSPPPAAQLAAPHQRGKSNDLADVFETEEHSLMPPPPPPATAKKPVNKHNKATTAAELVASLDGLNVHPAPSTSCAGGVHSLPGSIITESAGHAGSYALRATAANGTEIRDDAGNKAPERFMGTQVSGDDRRNKKMSIVEKPIHQNMKRSKRIAAKKQVHEAPVAKTTRTAPKKRAGLRSAGGGGGRKA